MTTLEIKNRCNVTEDVAEMVCEYLAETSENTDMELLFAVNSILTMCAKHEQYTKSPATCKSVKRIYEALPYTFRKQYGSRYIEGYMEFLMRGRVI